MLGKWTVSCRSKNFIEKITFDGCSFHVSKSHSEDLKKSTDPFSGEHICPNRYPTKVSAMWVMDWIEKNHVLHITKDEISSIKEIADMEYEITKLTECIPEKNSKKMMSEILKYSDIKNLDVIIKILKLANKKNVSLEIINHGFIKVSNADYSKTKEVIAISKLAFEGYSNRLTGFWFCPEQGSFSIKKEFARDLQRAIRSF